jgi:hypothetical protein
MVPFLALGVGWIAPSWMRSRVGGGLFLLSVLWSIGMVMLESLAGQQFPQYQRFPLVDYVWPRWREGDLARNWGVLLGLRGLSSLIPLVLVWGFGLWRLIRPAGPALQTMAPGIPGGSQ